MGSNEIYKVIVIGLMALTILNGCANLAYLPGQKAIGNLRIIGEHVQVNAKPAIDGQTIVNSDVVTTGSNSSAYIDFYSGGFVQLDENTDPIFGIDWEEIECKIKHFIEYGRVFVDTNKKCKVDADTAISSIQSHGTQYNVQVSRESLITTVIEGEVAVSIPNPITLAESQQAIVTKAGAQSGRTLNTHELQAVVKWRDKFPHPGPIARSGSQKVCDCAD